MSRRAVVRSGDGQAKTVEHLGLIVREFDRDVFEPHRRIDELGDLSGVVGELAVAFDRRVAKSFGVRWLFGVFSAAARAASVELQGDSQHPIGDWNVSETASATLRDNPVKTGSRRAR
jgi:hypothetical protein